MAHFAEIGIDNVVTRVIALSNKELLDENHIEQESRGGDFCSSLFGGVWVQTSYNGTIRKNFAGVGYTYDTARDAFIPPKPFDSWTLEEETCCWVAPDPIPDDGNNYTWNEETQTWELIE